MMNFRKTHYANFYRNSWISTNAINEVMIMERPDGDFEFWNESDLVSLHPSFEIAVRAAASTVPFKMPAA